MDVPDNECRNCGYTCHKDHDECPECLEKNPDRTEDITISEVFEPICQQCTCLECQPV